MIRKVSQLEDNYNQQSGQGQYKSWIIEKINKMINFHQVM